MKKDQERCSSEHPGADFGRYFSDLVIAEKDVPCERRRMEIRKQLELKRLVAISIPVGLSFAVLPIIRECLFGEHTLANMAGSACSFASFMMITLVIVSRIFRRMENRRLEAEFPSERFSHAEARSDVQAR